MHERLHLNCVVQVVANNRGILIYCCLYNVLFVDSPGKASLKKLLFHVPEDVSGFGLNNGDPGSHPSFLSYRHKEDCHLEAEE
jgi:hypothetical protein